ncbi:DUF2612 domain-containing protein [Azospirillum argentinense]
MTTPPTVQERVDDAQAALKAVMNALGLYVGQPDLYPGAGPVTVASSPGDWLPSDAVQAALQETEAALQAVTNYLPGWIGAPVVPAPVPPLGTAMADYLSLITSEHASQPNFAAVMTALLQPLVDGQSLLYGLSGRFDLDRAVGAQIDVIGLWVGVSRNLSVPLPNVYFSFGIAGLGFGEGTWWTPGTPTSQVVVLPDDGCRTLIRARIAANNWDGTVPGAHTVWATAFAGTGYRVLIQDNQDMTMDFALLGPIPDAVTLALFQGGYLDVKPAGVRINNYWTPTAPSAPYFGFGAQNDSIAGFGSGAWGAVTSP